MRDSFNYRDYTGDVEIVPVGKFHFDGKVSITDPCYNDVEEDIMGKVPVVAGDYECEVLKYNSGSDKGIIAAIAISLVDSDFDFSQMLPIGDIGVDAGIAGFFSHKPNYNAEEWSDFCDSISEGSYWIKENGFFSYSGYGDGGYVVYGHPVERDEKLYDGLTIIFIEPFENDYDMDDEDDFVYYEENYDEDYTKGLGRY